MTKPAREVIEKAGTEAFAAFLDEYRIRAQNPGAGPASTRDWLEEACGRYRETFLSALAAAGYVVVAREPTRAMWAKSGDALVNDKRAKQARAHHDHIGGLVWGAMFAAAEAEAKGDTDAG